MSIFITSVGATDNEICVPISQSILDIMETKEFQFRGVPAVESHVLIRHNQIFFTLNCCQLKTTPLALSFTEIQQLIDSFRENRFIPATLRKDVNEKLEELDKIVSLNCSLDKDCACCVVQYQ